MRLLVIIVEKMLEDRYIKEDFWLSGAAKYLISLYRLGGESNARKLIDYMSEHYGTSHTSFYSLTPVLKEKGYIELIEDGRKKIVKLTDKGKKIAEKLSQFADEL